MYNELRNFLSISAGISTVFIVFQDMLSDTELDELDDTELELCILIIVGKVQKCAKKKTKT